VRVVGHDQQRRLGGGDGKELKRGQRDPVEIGQHRLVQAKRRPQQIALLRGDARYQGQDRPQ
jgi:hypothetical protein